MNQYREGQIARGPNGEQAVFRGGQWVQIPQGTSAETLGPVDVSSQWGPGARQLPNGRIVRMGPRGGMTVLQAENDSEPGKLAAAEARTRFNLGIDPIIQAEHNLQAEMARSGGGNPLNRDWGAALLEAVPFDGGALARMAGGQDYQNFQQAAKSYESSLMPIMSGAAVTPSEAQRLLRADLPQLGDTPETLERKRANREFRANAIAEGVGRERPFPDRVSGESREQRRDRRAGSRTPEQIAYFQQQGYDQNAEPGTRARPYAEFEGMNFRELPAGSFFVDRAGTLRTVPAREANNQRLRNRSRQTRSGVVSIRRVE